jgi:hypothetical protein
MSECMRLLGTVYLVKVAFTLLDMSIYGTHTTTANNERISSFTVS